MSLYRGVLAWLLFAGCTSQSLQVSVQLSPLPENATSARLIVTRARKQAELGRSLLSIGDVAQKKRSLDLLLDLPGGDALSDLRMAAALFQSNGCLIAIGEGQPSGDEPGSRIQIPLSPVQNCPGKSSAEPILLGVTPSRFSSEGSEIEVRGFGLTDKSQLELSWPMGTLPATQVVWHSPLSLKARIPPLPKGAPRNLHLRLAGSSPSFEGAAGIPIATYDESLAFGSEIRYGFDKGSGIVRVAFADVDRNGTTDMLAIQGPIGTYGPTEHWLYLNKGDGTLVKQVLPLHKIDDRAFPPSTRTVQFADLDGDLAADLVDMGFDGKVRIYYNLKKGPFETPYGDNPDQILQLPFFAYAGRVADTDGDGFPDLVVVLSSNSEDPKAPGIVRTYKNLYGERRLRQLVAATDCLLLAKPRDSFVFELSDIDHDGKPDAAVVFQEAKYITALPSVRCDKPREYIPEAKYSILNATFADADGDGLVDLIARPYAGTPYTSFHKGDGRGAFASGVDLKLDEDGSASLADFTGDGQAELLLPYFHSEAPKERVALYSRVNGVFTKRLYLDGGYNSVGGRPIPVDLDQDGRLDLVIVAAGYGNGDTSPPSIKVFLNRPERKP